MNHSICDACEWVSHCIDHGCIPIFKEPNELPDETRATMSGVYAITSPSGNRYIGSSINMHRRWQEHRRSLAKGKHHALRLQRAANKYGIENLRFEVLSVCEVKDLLSQEQACMDSIKPAYNTSKHAASPMLDQEVVRRIKELNKSPERRAAASNRSKVSMNRLEVKARWRASVAKTHASKSYRK